MLGNRLWRVWRRRGEVGFGRRGRNEDDVLLEMWTVRKVLPPLPSVGLAVAGAAKDHPGIMIVGLIFAVALMGIAANVIAQYIERYKWIAWFGMAVIVYVAGKMIYEGWTDPNLGIGHYVIAKIGG